MQQRMLQPAIETQGFELWRGALSPQTVADLIIAIESAGATGGVYGLRNLLRRSPRVREVAGALRTPVEPILGAGAFPTRALFVDKLPRVKDGVPRVQPPVSVLQNMLTLRLHLDRAEAENGALIVLPGTTPWAGFRATGQSRPMQRSEPSAARPRPPTSSPFARSCCTCPERARDQATDASFRSNTQHRPFRCRWPGMSSRTANVRTGRRSRHGATR